MTTFAYHVRDINVVSTVVNGDTVIAVENVVVVKCKVGAYLYGVRKRPAPFEIM